MSVGGVVELVSRLRAEAETPEAAVVVTGGDAETFLPLPVEGIVRHEPGLIFRGIRIALEADREGRSKEVD